MASLPIFLLGCKSERMHAEQPKEGFYTVHAYGETKNDSYIFCGFIAQTVDYKYRTGTWEFVTEDSINIARGPYKEVVKEVYEEGGCPITIVDNEIDLEKWNFWNLAGDEIEPNQLLINLIESYERKIILYLR